jgi:nucleoside-diphosphate-sugar epimerase
VLVGDPAKLVAATGWAPEFTLDRTLADVLEHARGAGRPST